MNVYISGNISAMRGPCDSGFHIPTKDELTNFLTIAKAILPSTQFEENFITYLKMPRAERLSSSDGTRQNYNFGWYHSCSIQNVNNSYALKIQGTNNGVVITSGYFSNAFSIRPFKDTPVVPDSGWTALYSDKIYHNSTLGLISISSDGVNWTTISDKNLGATTVYNSGDTMSEANCGKFYQWGNNYGFPFTGATTTSSSQVDASSYGPGNYYSSSTFITYHPRDSSDNYNLRGGVSGGINELKNAYIGEAPYEGDELCFTANEANSTIKLRKIGTPTDITLETSSNGRNWSTYTFGDIITLSNVGDKVYWRNTSTTDTGFSINTNNSYYRFEMTGSIAGSGDVNYLLNKNSTTTVSSCCFYNLFNGCNKLTSAPILPATTLADRCYSQMFAGCAGLTTLPALPATTLVGGCYYAMFSSCANLTSLPKLNAITYPDYSCAAMFINCSKIKLSTTQTGAYQTAYRIPTTGTGTTVSNALTNMFYGTGGTFTGAPSINTTYYTSNTVV